MFTQNTFRLAISTILLFASSTASTRQKGDVKGDHASPAPHGSVSETMPDDNLPIAYARACLRLAKAELAEAREQNHRVKNSVTEYDLKRMQLQVQSAEKNLSYAEQGADYSQSIIQHIAL